MRSKGPLRALLALLLLGASVAPLRADQSLDDSASQQASVGRHVFDGASRLAGGPASPVEEAADSARGGGLLAPSARAARKDSVVPAPSRASKGPRKESRFERFQDRLFTVSWWGYHAAWAVDTTMTGLGIAQHRGFEADPINTLFGKRNVAGVVGSLIAVHVGVSAFTMWLHHKAQKHHGLARFLLNGAAIGINIAGIAAHVSGALSWVPLF